MTFNMTPTRYVLGLMLLATALGCRKDRTEIVLGMATDLSASTPLSSVRLQVFSLPEDVLIPGAAHGDRQQRRDAGGAVRRLEPGP